MKNGSEFILPKAYLDFYEKCKSNRPQSMIGTDLRNDSDHLNSWANELFEETGIQNFLTKSDFVFMMHQGYMFWYFDTRDGENPDVYFYMEGRLQADREYKLIEFLERYPHRLCDESNKDIEWEKQKDFYRDLIENHGWSQQPMVELIDELKNKGFWRKYFPSNSHEALGLSTYFDDVRDEKPMLYIVYKSINETFEIHYQRTPGKTVNIEVITKKLEQYVFDKIEGWLNKNEAI